MINLLPPQAKKELVDDKNWRLYFILSFLILTFFISFSLVLFSVKNFIAGEVESQKILLAQSEQELENPQWQVLQKNLANFNKSFVDIKSFYNEQFDSADLLNLIAKTVPEGIYFTNLSITKSEEKTDNINCSLSGFAPDRDTLLKFKENLEKEDTLTDINFPPSVWVKPVDINFNISFKAE